MSEPRQMTAEDAAMVAAFLERLPEGDRTFFKEPVDVETVQRWLDDARNRRWVVCDDEVMQAMLALIPGVGWSDHVGELRLVVGAEHRGKGLGRRLARYGLTDALRLGLTKIIVEVVADKAGDIEMFTSIGFHPEALLTDQIKDTDGTCHDLVILAHAVADVASGIDVLGLDDAVAG